FMASFNKVILLGNLTRDPELRYTPQGSAVCEFALALNYVYTNKQTGQKVEEVSFIDIVAWGKTGEICAEYLKKGRQVMIEGRLKQDRWEAQDGKKMSKVRVTAENVQFVGSRPAGEGGGGNAPRSGGAAPAGGGPEEGPPPGAEEDIPF
ncbi:MAG TPA: single-stranded DNA-binding protein, partial [Planctomycetota bacterium]|nr:single-stranded DNA-binding protein [Planctomycetota bacterium]